MCIKTKHDRQEELECIHGVKNDTPLLFYHKYNYVAHSIQCLELRMATDLAAIEKINCFCPWQKYS